MINMVIIRKVNEIKDKIIIYESQRRIELRWVTAPNITWPHLGH